MSLVVLGECSIFLGVGSKRGKAFCEHSSSLTHLRCGLIRILNNILQKGPEKLCPANISHIFFSVFLRFVLCVLEAFRGYIDFSRK